MRRAAPPGKGRIAELAPWFKLSKYQGLATEDPWMWFVQLAIRIDLQRTHPMISGKGNQMESRQKAAHSRLMSAVRESGVVGKKLMKSLLATEKELSPEGFATLKYSLSDLASVRRMNIGDLDGVIDTLKQARQLRELMLGLHPERDLPKDDANFHRTVESQDPIYERINPHELDLTKLLVTVDLTLSRASIIRQFAQLVDQEKGLRSMVMPQIHEPKTLKYKTWNRSNVLPYIDLTQWRQELPQKVRASIKNADIALALEIDPKTLAEIKKTHARELTDPLSLTFRHLVDAVIASRRKPLMPLRRKKRPENQPAN